MPRLGYERYGDQGTDAGAGVAALLAMVDGERLVGSHLTGTTAAMPFGPALDVDALPERDRDRASRFNDLRDQGMGYLHLQATSPQTLAYALTDSPVAQLAWVVEKFQEWTDPAAALPEDAVDRDQLLTNVSLTWFNRAGGSSAHATYEGMQAYREIAASMGDGGWDEGPEGPPVGYAVFAADTTIRSLADPQGRIEHWSSSTAAATSPRWRCRTCWSTTCARSSGRCAEAVYVAGPETNRARSSSASPARTRDSMPSSMCGRSSRANQPTATDSSSATWGSPGHPAAREDEVEVRRAVAVRIRDRPDDTHLRESIDPDLHTRLLERLATRRHRRLLPRVDDAGDRCPLVVVGTLHHQQLVRASYDGGDAGQPELGAAHHPAQLDDEIGTGMGPRLRDVPRSQASSSSSRVSIHHSSTCSGVQPRSRVSTR